MARTKETFRMLLLGSDTQRREPNHCRMDTFYRLGTILFLLSWLRIRMDQNRDRCRHLARSDFVFFVPGMWISVVLLQCPSSVMVARIVGRASHSDLRLGARRGSFIVSRSFAERLSTSVSVAVDDRHRGARRRRACRGDGVGVAVAGRSGSMRRAQPPAPGQRPGPEPRNTRDAPHRSPTGPRDVSRDNRRSGCCRPRKKPRRDVSPSNKETRSRSPTSGTDPSWMTISPDPSQQEHFCVSYI